MADFFTQQEVEARGLVQRKEELDREVARRYALSEEQLEKEDRERLAASPNAKKCVPVFSVLVFQERYEDLVRGMIIGKFHIRDRDHREDCYQDVMLKLIQTRHLLAYRNLIMRPVPEPPMRKPKEQDSAFQRRQARWEKDWKPHQGKIKVCYPTFETHIFTVTQSCCVNNGLKAKQNPATNAISLSLSYDDDDRRTLIDKVLDPKAGLDMELALTRGEIFDRFQQFLIDKYARPQKDGSYGDSWGPVLPMTRVKVHTESSEPVAFSDTVSMLAGPDGTLSPIQGTQVSSDSNSPDAISRCPLVYDDKGRLVPKVVGSPVMDEKGELVFEETGETVRRSLSQVFRFLRMGYRQVEIARILQVTAGSPGNWFSRIREDWQEFVTSRELSEEVLT